MVRWLLVIVMLPACGGDTPPAARPSTAQVSLEDAYGDLDGLSAADIDRGIRSGKAAILACYQRALDRDRELMGKLVVRFAIDADGAVLAAEVVTEKSNLDEPGVEACVVHEILGLRFPAAGGALVEYPLLFSSG